MHVLLIEAALSGHHSIYLEHTVRAFVDAGHKVTIALPSDLIDLDTSPKNRLKHIDSIEWHPYAADFNLVDAGLSALIRREIAIRRIFGATFQTVNRKTHVDFVFLPFFDYCLYAFGLMGTPFAKTPFSGICMRPSFHYKYCGVIAPKGKLDRIKRLLFIRILKNKFIKNLFTIDELLIQYVKKNYVSAGENLHYLADPTDEPRSTDTLATRRSFDTPSSAKVILVFGAIDERKHIHLLLDTLATELSLPWHVWIIGRQSESIRNELNGPRWDCLNKDGRIHIMDEFVSDVIENEAFCACDVVWTVYKSHYGMSGVLVQAGRRNKFVIGARDGLIGYFIEQRGLGMTIEPTVRSTLFALRKIDRQIELKEINCSSSIQFESHNWREFRTSIGSKI